MKLSQAPSGNLNGFAQVNILVPNEYRNSISINGAFIVTLNFFADNYGTAQNVTVTAKQDDNVIDESSMNMIMLTGIQALHGREYDGVTASVGVTVTDDDDHPKVEFNQSSSTVPEGNTTHHVRINLDPAHAFETDLSYSVGGTATPGATGDFTIADSGEITANGGSVEIPVVIREDTSFEGNETIVLTLVEGDNYDLEDKVGAKLIHTITIEDNDMPTTPEVSITRDAASVTEGAMASFTVTRTGPTTAALEVLLAVSEDSTGGRDFVDDTFEVNTMVSIPIGSSSAKFAVATINNDDDEPNGSLTVSLRFSANYTWGISFFARVTINDNDLPLVSITPGAAVPEGTAATFTVAREGVTTGPLTVLLSVSEDSTGGRDFVAPGDEGNKMVTIAANQLSASYSVDTTGDTTDEPNGEVTVSIRTDATTYRIDSANNDADVTVNDNDLPLVSITPGAAVTEGTAAIFTVARVGDTTSALTVLLTVSEETTQGQDFVAPGDEGDDSIEIPAGEDDVTYSVPTTLDTTDEEHGHVTVAIRASTATYRIDSAKDDANVTVNDDDDPDPTIPVVSITRDASSVAEGTAASFTVTRTLATTTALIVNLEVSEDNDDGQDFVANTLEGSKTVTIPIGSATEKYTVATTDDDTDEPNGEVTVKLLAASNSSGDYTSHNTDHTAMVTVNDNDDPDPITPVVSITRDASSVTEGAMASFTVSRTGSTTAALNVLLTVSEDSTGGRNFVDAGDEGNTMVSIPIGSQTVKFPVETTDDNIDEPNGSVTVALRNSSDYTNDSPSSATVTVNDNDGTTPPPPNNTPPTMAQEIPDQTATPGTPFSFTIPTTTFADADNDDLTYSATLSDNSPLPRWLDFDSSTRTFSGPTPEDFTSITVRVTADDGNGGTNFVDFVIGQPSDGTSDSLVRFGRTLGVQAVNTITDRLSAPRQFGLTGQVAGQTLVNGQRPNQQQNTLPTNPPNHTPGGADPLGEATTIATDTLQTGTAFTYTEETPNGTTISYWGQGTRSSFASENITDGKVTTLAFGTDWQKDNQTYGLMIARSSGDITYRQGSTKRTMTTRMRAIIPYGGMDLANNLSLWGAFGLGQGELTLKPVADNGDEQTTDLDWQMVASGIRGDLSSIELLPAAELGWRADALWTRTSSDEKEGLPATRSKSTRLRVGVEIGWDHQLASSTIVRPYMGFDILYDGGDAETGLGVDVSGGVDWFDPAKGLTVGISGHKVIHHVDDAYESWGVSFSLAYDPRPATKEGFSAVVSHAVDREEAVGGTSLVGTTPDMDNPVTMDRNWQMEAAYGTARDEGIVGSSYTRVRGSDDPEDLRVGYRIEPDTEIAEDLTVDTWASSPLEDGMASNAAGVDLVWRW